MNCPVCCKQLKLAVSHRKVVRLNGLRRDSVYRTVRSKQYRAYCDDDGASWRYVGADCYRHIKKAGVTGYKQSDDPGPRWYFNEADALRAIAIREST